VPGMVYDGKNCDRGWDVCISQYSRVIAKEGARVTVESNIAI
jgi:hypothetical protein